MKCRAAENQEKNAGAYFRILITVLISAVVCCAGCSSGKEQVQPGQSRAIPVSVMPILSKNMPVQVHAIGTIEAYSTVSIKSMTSGELQQVHFTEGQKVKRGSLLFEIDPRPFEADLARNEANLARDSAALREAKANLVKDSAQAENAEVEKKRYDLLVEKGVAPKEQSDQMRTNAEAAAAAVHADQAAVDSANEAIRADRAAVDQAKVQLSYCKIYSPIDGRAGALMIDRGNIVKANDVPMVIINQIQPIYADFAVPEQYLPEIRRYLSRGRIKVEAVSHGNVSSEGTLTFIDNTVDSATGTIKLKATFANADEQLWPGQFVNIVINLSSHSNAVVAPNQAIQSGQEGSYVYVVEPDMTVVSRPIKLGRVVGDETIIESGLKPGEKVVTDGQLRLVPGASVQIKPPLEMKQENLQ
jgi:multidrug efflux system membrane fusion protein